MGWRWRHRWGKRFEIQQIIPFPLKDNTPIILTQDELEVLKLIDLEGLTQEEASLKLGISRPTLSKILKSARKKIIQAILDGKPIYIR